MINYFNPTQTRMDNLMQQKQMIEQQMQALQQYQMPPININNNMTPTPQVNFDFNGKWVDNEKDAKEVTNNNLPLILFDRNEPIFYMKNLDGSFKKYKFLEVIEQGSVTESSRIDALEAKLNTIIESLSNSPTTNKKPNNQEKTAKKEGVSNE